MINASNRPHILGHVYHGLLQLPNDTLLCQCLWVVVLDVLDLKNTLVYPEMASQLRVLMHRVPILSPFLSILRS